MGALLLENHEAIKGQNLVHFIQRGFMSPDVSDAGEAIEEEWEATCAKSNAGSRGLEKCQVAFRATWVSKCWPNWFNATHTQVSAKQISVHNR